MLWCNFMKQFSNMEFWIDDFKEKLLQSFGDRIPQHLVIAIRHQRQPDRVQAEDTLHILVQDAEIVIRGIRPNPPDTAFRQA